MKTDNQPIGKVLAMNATSFFIPPFQRAYAWGKQEIERYFSDVSRIIDSELDSKHHDKLEHFFGTLVIKDEKDGFASRSIVVDGQQRLTTTLIFLIALRDQEESEEYRAYITNTYLTNSSSSFEDKIKLKQVTRDWDSYRALINGEYDKACGVINNAYLLFSRLIRDKKIINPAITLHHFIIAIERMNVAIIFLDERAFKGEDPQIIFETLNSLGRPLTLSDLVRNYVLLNMNSKKQSTTYENIWHPKVELILGEGTSAFLRDYLQLKLTSAVKAVSDNNTKEIYHIFKEFVESNFNSHSDFVDEIVPYSKWYSWIINAENSDRVSKDLSNDREIKELLRNIFHDIKAEAFKPIILGLIEKHQNSILILSDERFISILEVVRTYLIRRRILGLTQGENKEIPAMCKHIESICKGDKEIIALLSNMFYRLRFPNDEEMTSQLTIKNFYELKKYSKFILGKIEEHNSKVYVDFRNSKVTVEHIMPQTLDSVWINDLGVNHKQIHETYLHTLGNLILTEFNSEMGNKPFEDKKAKLEKSNLNYRCFVLGESIWNEDSIIRHRRMMISNLLDTFSLPELYRYESNWNTKETEHRNISPLDLEATEIVEGNKPELIVIDGVSLKVKTWQDVLIVFLNYINRSPYYNIELFIERQESLAYKNDIILRWNKLSQLIDDNFDLSRRYKTLDGKYWDKLKSLSDDELFVHVNVSAAGCIRRVAYIMNLYNMADESIEIVLK